MTPNRESQNRNRILHDRLKPHFRKLAPIELASWGSLFPPDFFQPYYFAAAFSDPVGFRWAIKLRVFAASSVGSTYRRFSPRLRARHGMIGTARAFLNLIRKAAPALFAPLRLPTASDPEHDAISSVYAEVPDVDFSGSILAACPHELSVVSAGHAGMERFGPPGPGAGYGRAIAKEHLSRATGADCLPACCQQSEQDIHFVLGADHESDAKDPAGRLQTEIGESDATRALDPDSFFAYRRA